MHQMRPTLGTGQSYDRVPLSVPARDDQQKNELVLDSLTALAHRTG
jgi:hypothetical protein